MFYNTKVEPLFKNGSVFALKNMFYSIFLDLHQFSAGPQGQERAKRGSTRQSLPPEAGRAAATKKAGRTGTLLSHYYI